MNDSYSAARIHAMRTKLIRPEEYERLLRMSVQEIVNFLHNSEYREDIDALALKELEDLEIIDSVLAHNGSRDIMKLRRIAGPEHTAALLLFLRQNDLWNLNLIADAIAGGADPNDALKRYARRGSVDLKRFAAAKTIEDLSAQARTEFPSLTHRPVTLAEFRDALANEALPMTGPFAGYFIDEMNIVRLLMLKRDGMQPDQIVKRLRAGGTLLRSTLAAAATAPDLAQALRALRTTTYGAVTSSGEEDLQQGSLVRFEAELHSDILRRIRKESVTHPLDAELVLRYLSEKGIEQENLRLLIKGKRLGLDETFIREHLVTA